jgi:arylsulfatase A-like enzyme
MKYILICACLLIINCTNRNVYGQDVKLNVSKLNILFITVDELRPQLGAYGKSQMVTPNIDRLARKGQLFTQAYVTYPSCAPSRNSILSGLYPSRSRWTSWNASQDKEVPGVVSLPMYFKNHGYTTISLGKIYNNFGDGQGSWDKEWDAPHQTTDAWDYEARKSIEIFRKRNGKWFKDLAPRNNHHLPKRGPAFEKPNVKDIAYRDGRIANRAVETLQNFHASSPFFLAVGFRGPHLPYNAPRRYWELYDKDDIKLPSNMYTPKGAPSVSLTNSGELRAYSNVPNKGPIPDSLARTLVHGYYANISYTDRLVGRVINALERFGLEKSTIIVLTSDHGTQLGSHGMWGKHTNYKISNHVPLIMRVPGQKTDVRQHGLISLIDLYPTLCDLVGLSQPFQLQGTSFAKKITNPNLKGDQQVFWRAPTGNGETIMTQNYSYTEFFNNKGKRIARMLYDLRKDPHENINVVKKAKYKNVIKKLHKRLHRHMKARNIIHIK